MSSLNPMFPLEPLKINPNLVANSNPNLKPIANPPPNLAIILEP